MLLFYSQWYTAVTMPPQFAYLQLGTILLTLVRKLEMRIEERIPKHNYHVSAVHYVMMHDGVLDLAALDLDGSAS
jgi:hypothetical protein